MAILFAKKIKISKICSNCNFHLQGTASEATLVALLGAKAKKIKQVKEQHPNWTENEIISKLVAYCSCEYIFNYFLIVSIINMQKFMINYIYKKILLETLVCIFLYLKNNFMYNISCKMDI